jgi:pyruvate dehydrogenase E1 component
MYGKEEDVMYYITLYNEKYPMPALPQEDVKEGVIKGLYKLRPATIKAKGSRVHLFGSGSLLREALRAQGILAEQFGIAGDVWSVTSYTELRRDALNVERWNLLHPTEKPRRCYVQDVLAKEEGAFIAVSDSIRALPGMIAPWVPGGLYALGTDGFGRSDSRKALRRFFEVDAEFIALAALRRLAERGEIKAARVQQAIGELKIDPEKANPMES